MSTAKQRAAENAGFIYIEVPLAPGAGPKQWICPRTNSPLCVEAAVLAHFQREGWRGFSGEGGLVLNLIKAMSFPKLGFRSRTMYLEALYSGNVAFDVDRFRKEDLLAQILRADKEQVERNFAHMISRGPFVEKFDYGTSTTTTSILDFFPGLEAWMLAELMEVAGRELIHRIATKFAEDPYTYRRGWPDITMWRNDELRFVEVKAPGDSLGKSQKSIATEFAKPLGLDFHLAAVIPATGR